MDRFNELHDRVSTLSKKYTDSKKINDLTNLDKFIIAQKNYYESIPANIRKANTLDNIISKLSRKIDQIDAPIPNNIIVYTEDTDDTITLAYLTQSKADNKKLTNDIKVYVEKNAELLQQLMAAKLQFDREKQQIISEKKNLETKYQDLDNKLEQSTLKNEQLLNKNNELQLQLDNKKSEAIDLAALFNSERDVLKDKNTNLQKEVEQLKIENDISKKTTDSLFVDIENLNIQIDEMKKKNTELEQVQKEYKEKLKYFEEKNKDMDQLLQKNTKLETEKNALEKELEKVKKECEEKNAGLEREKNTLKEELRGCEEKNAGLETEKTELLSKNEKLLQDNEKLQKDKDLISSPASATSSHDTKRSTGTKAQTTPYDNIFTDIKHRYADEQKKINNYKDSGKNGYQSELKKHISLVKTLVTRLDMLENDYPSEIDKLRTDIKKYVKDTNTLYEKLKERASVQGAGPDESCILM
jgi:chromosome segregation ATPase